MIRLKYQASSSAMACRIAAIFILVALAAGMSSAGFVEIEARITNCCPMCKDCDDDPSNGCETDVGGDVENCGACGISCFNVTGPPLQHTHVSCSNGTCVYACDHMTGDCDYDILSNGCETDLSGLDPLNCGECATPCADYTTEFPHALADAPHFYVLPNTTSSAGNPMQPPKLKSITKLLKWLILG